MSIKLRLNFKQILTATKKDEILMKIISYLKFGWPVDVEPEYQAFFRKKDELFVEKDILLWGYCAAVPTLLCQNVLEELHGSHLGIVKIRALIYGSYVSWPKIDKDIENTVRSCHAYQATKENPPKQLWCHGVACQSMTEAAHLLSWTVERALFLGDH